MEVNYAMIEALVLSAQVKDRQIHCRFRLPGTDRVLEADSPLIQEDTTTSRAIRTVKRNVLWEVRRLAYNMVRELAGPGFFRQTGEQLVNTTIREGEFFNTFSEADKQTAVVRAFQKVRHQYVYDTLSQSWRAAEASSTLTRQMAVAPLSHPYDREILGRILMELAKANATISEEEREFMERYLGLTPLQYQELALADPVSAVEAEEVSSEAKPTIFQLACTVALVDQRLGPREKQVLEAFGQNLGLSEEERSKLAAAAKAYVLENALGLHIPREKLFALADQLEMDRTEAERAYVRYRRKNL